MKNVETHCLTHRPTDRPTDRRRPATRRVALPASQPGSQPGSRAAGRPSAGGDSVVVCHSVSQLVRRAVPEPQPGGGPPPSVSQSFNQSISQSVAFTTTIATVIIISQSRPRPRQSSSWSWSSSSASSPAATHRPTDHKCGAGQVGGPPCLSIGHAQLQRVTVVSAAGNGWGSGGGNHENSAVVLNRLNSEFLVAIKTPPV